MARKPLITSLIVAVCCATTSCRIYEHYDIPPMKPDEAAEWWKKLPERLDLGLMAAYVAASDVHLARGTSATYIKKDTFLNMFTGTCYIRYLQCPPPPYVLAQMRTLVKSNGNHVQYYDHFVEVEGCIGCTSAEALKIWDDEVCKQKAAATQP